MNCLKIILLRSKTIYFFDFFIIIKTNTRINKLQNIVFYTPLTTKTKYSSQLHYDIKLHNAKIEMKPQTNIPKYEIKHCKIEKNILFATIY